MKKDTIIIIIIIIVVLTLITFSTMKIVGFVKNFKIRNDGKIIGEGFFGASRSGGTRKHKGIDIVTKEGEEIIAPFDLKMLRIAYPYAESQDMKGGLYETLDGKQIKIFYMLPVIKQEFKKGDIIGYSQSVSKYWKSPKMTDHIHLEMYDKNKLLLNPENYIV